MALPERGRFGLVPTLPWTEMKEAEPFGQTLLSSSTSTNASTIIVKLPAHQLNSHTPPTTRTFVMKPTPTACCDERRKKGVSNLVELLRVDVGIHKSNDLTLVAPVKSVNQVPTGFQLLLTLFVRRKIANGFCLGSLKRAKPTGREKLSCSHCQCWLNFGAKWGVGGLLVEDTTCCWKLLPATRGHVP
ncbi:hypothetical protein V1477_014875 [Vespula maculifrons]|uniref:Uncharacterized protein n=1 Tax=Vespula maculifrons TaxID=7453 RepID=A0ABD2BIR1_VESMC